MLYKHLEVWNARVCPESQQIPAVGLSTTVHLPPFFPLRFQMLIKSVLVHYWKLLLTGEATYILNEAQKRTNNWPQDPTEQTGKEWKLKLYHLPSFGVSATLTRGKAHSWFQSYTWQITLVTAGITKKRKHINNSIYLLHQNRKFTWTTFFSLFWSAAR